MASPKNKSRATHRVAKNAQSKKTDTKVEDTVTPPVVDTITVTEKAPKTSKKKAASSVAASPSKQDRVVLSPEDRERRNLMCRISGYLRRSEDTFKAVSLVLNLLEKSNSTLKADELWSSVSRYDTKYYQNVYKKRRNSVNPLRLANVKRPKTDYAFFTKDTYNSVATSNKDANFGAISKIIQGMWVALPADTRQKYADLAAEDNLRYYNDKKHVLGMLDGSIKPKTKADKEIYAKIQRSQSSSDDSKTSSD